MPATRSRTSTEQPAEVAAEEVKQVQAEDGTEIVPQVPVPAADVVKSAEAAVVQPESEAAAASDVQTEEQPAGEPVVPAAVPSDVVTNGSAEPVASETSNGGSEATNGSAVTNGSAAEVVAEESAPEAAAEPVSDAKRKSEVGDGDVVPDSTDVKKQKVLQSESEPAVAAEEPVVADATA